MKRMLWALVAAALVLSAASARAADYTLDPVHSTLIYRIKHLQSSFSYGRFDKPMGTFSYDAGAPEKTTFSLSVDVDDIDSGNAARDKHLKSPDFFNAKEFPKIEFTSTAVKKNADGTLAVTGDLNLHGVTKSIVLNLTVVGTGSGPDNKTRTGFEGTIDIKRSDYGMTGLQGLVGDDVRVIVSLEGIQK